MANTASPPRPDQLRGESGLLPNDPPNWIVFAVAWLVIVVFLTGLLVAIFVPFPDSVQCPYVLMVKGGTDPIQSPNIAIVRKVLVSEGQRVAAGDELFVLSSEEIRGWDTDLRTLKDDLQERLDDLQRSDTSDASELAIKQRETAETQDEIKYRQTYAVTIRALMERIEKLSATGAISQDELINHRLELAAGEKDLSLAQKSLDQVQLEVQEMGTEHDRKHADAMAEIQKIQVHIQALEGEMGDTQQNLRSIRAPYDAVVVSLAERNEGSVVQNGQELCQLARPGAPLYARLLLSEPGMPRLALGQKVRYFAQAFPYQRYGTVTGHIQWLSPSAVPSSQGDQFIADASLDQTFLAVHGIPHPLQAGMTGMAHIIVGSRTLIEYAFEPIRQLREDARP